MASTTVLCGSLSKHPVSLGARMHRAGYAALGLDYAYVPFAVTDLEGALRGMRALGIRGFGVSMPFKLEVMPLLDALDGLAEKIGAVNTIVNDGGRLTGFNTDAFGAVRALSEALPLAGKSACVIGAGGAARAVAFGLAAEGMRVHVSNRTRARALSLAEHVSRAFGISATASGISDFDAHREMDVLVNASSAGMTEYGAESPVPASWLRRELVVMDIVYKPTQTALLDAARRAGCRTVHGGRMLLHQACRQFELYTGTNAPLGAMEAALQVALAGG